MPGFDRTGPWGAGPMTGGGRGVCGSARMSGAGYGRAYGTGRGFGPRRGLGMGYGGRGRGIGPRWGGAGYGPAYVYDDPYPITADREKDFLRDQAQSLKVQLEDIEARISQLESKGD